jgi:hypothetical protein
MPGAAGSGGPTVVDVPDTTYLTVVVAVVEEADERVRLAAVVEDVLERRRGKVAETRVEDAHATRMATTTPMARSPARAARQLGALSACAPRLIRVGNLPYFRP